MAHEFEIKTYDLMKDMIEDVRYFIRLHDHETLKPDAVIERIKDELKTFDAEFEEQFDKTWEELQWKKEQ